MISQDYRKTEFVHMAGPLAGRPSVQEVLKGTLYFALDTHQTFRSNGTTWDDVSDAGSYSLPANVALKDATNVFTVDQSFNTGLLERGRSVKMGEWIDYTPTFATAIDPQPSVGNGNLVGSYTIVGKAVFFRIRFIPGSTTTFGAGNFVLGTPTAYPMVGTLYHGNANILLYNSATGALYPGSSILAGNTGLSLVSPGAGYITSTSPFTWKANDWIFVHGFYDTP